MTRHFLEIDDLSDDELRAVLTIARRPDHPHVLEGRGVALLFAKPSARTRHSSELAVVQLGGHPVTVRPDEIDLDGRESVEDVTRTLGSYHALLAARVFEHSILERMAAVSPVPVVNLLSDRGHPIQVLADLLTIQAEFGGLEGVSITYLGDANNMAFSLGVAAGLLGMHLRVSHPPGYGFDDLALQRMAATGRPPELVEDPAEAVAGTDVVYTDAWYSMGQEEEAEVRAPVFAPWRVTEELVALAGPRAVFLHCLPAHRGVEVVDEVLDGPRSRIWPQAANRLHSARALFAWLVTRDTANE